MAAINLRNRRDTLTILSKSVGETEVHNGSDLVPLEYTSKCVKKFKVLQILLPATEWRSCSIWRLEKAKGATCFHRSRSPFFPQHSSTFPDLCGRLAGLDLGGD